MASYLSNLPAELRLAIYEHCNTVPVPQRVYQTMIHSSPAIQSLCLTNRMFQREVKSYISRVAVITDMERCTDEVFYAVDSPTRQASIDEYSTNSVNQVDTIIIPDSHTSQTTAKALEERMNFLARPYSNYAKVFPNLGTISWDTSIWSSRDAASEWIASKAKPTLESLFCASNWRDCELYIHTGANDLSSVKSFRNAKHLTWEGTLAGFPSLGEGHGKLKHVFILDVTEFCKDEQNTLPEDLRRRFTQVCEFQWKNMQPTFSGSTDIFLTLDPTDAEAKANLEGWKVELQAIVQDSQPAEDDRHTMSLTVGGDGPTRPGGYSVVSV